MIAFTFAATSDISYKFKKLMIYVFALQRYVKIPIMVRFGVKTLHKNKKNVQFLTFTSPL
jgi:hypothetical protein